MRILVVGAGAVGGYFGGRLIEKGEDVTFLVREKKQQQLKEQGLVIHSVNGDIHVQPKTILATNEPTPFDVVFISTKSYQLRDALTSLERFVSDYTVIIPLLNGIEHMEEMKAYFSPDQIFGGICFIESTLNDAGEIVQTSKKNDLVFGEWNGKVTARAKEIEEVFSGTKSVFQLSENIQKDMWHKYLFITTLSGVTSLMRSPIGPIRDTFEGRTYIQQLFEEIRMTMEAHRAPISDRVVEKQMDTLDNQAPSMKSSMLRDIERGAPIEVDHLQGFLLLLAERYGIETPLLRLVYQHLKVYERNLNM
ncbi:ketopantoate reductase family protein [Bacillus shivajii]|uniref:ketopantoate reductase family protein n=1 Tax=Bacillus shivajii TaxID=1983719 RepID=UPI001CF99A58|nr:ketopantoate reductase family protein [Bacillus shivajii]UCZ54228.1 ketopantoate reductase family protein [Bacillus shivajii]